MHAQKQRAEVLSRLSRLGPAADDELLLLVQLELAPRRAAPAGLIRRLRILDDQSFPAFLHGARVQRVAVADGLLAEPAAYPGAQPLA